MNSIDKLWDVYKFNDVSFQYGYAEGEKSKKLAKRFTDAFEVMITALGLKPAAMSLNGELSITLCMDPEDGSYGDYKNDHIDVMPGVVAHEWMHALDFWKITSSPLNPIADELYEMDTYLSESLNADKEMHPWELANVTVDVLRNADPVFLAGCDDDDENYDDDDEDSGEFHRAYDPKDNTLDTDFLYFSNEREMLARAFETYLESKLPKKNTTLIKHTKGFPYPKGKEKERVIELFEEFFNTYRDTINKACE